MSRIAFLFPGQGLITSHVGVGLYQSYRLFRHIADEVFDIVEHVIQFKLKSCLLTLQQSKMELDAIVYSSLGTFIIEYITANFLQSLGVIPEFLIGHSIGEYVAATLSGVFDLESAINLVYLRGKLLKKSMPGKMLNVPLPKYNVEELLSQDIEIAADHGESCIVSGSKSSIDNFIALLKKKLILSIPLNIDRAGHSSLLDPVLPEYKAELEKITLKKPDVPFVSNVTGRFINDDEAQSVQYWIDQFRNTVNFSAGLSTLRDTGVEMFVECGVGNSLTAIATTIFPEHFQVMNIINSDLKVEDEEIENKSYFDSQYKRISQFLGIKNAFRLAELLPNSHYTLLLANAKEGVPLADMQHLSFKLNHHHILLTQIQRSVSRDPDLYFNIVVDRMPPAWVLQFIECLIILNKDKKCYFLFRQEGGGNLSMPSWQDDSHVSALFNKKQLSIRKNLFLPISVN